MDIAQLRSEFPVFERRAYLNAGTCGPVPAAALRAAADVALDAAENGRAGEHFKALVDRIEQLRSSYAALLGAEPDDVAVTTSTSDGMVRVLQGLDLRDGDEVVTANDEHPGLVGPLGAMRRLRGVVVKAVPLADVADAVGPQTRLVACSHVSWITGQTAPPALAELGDDIPVLLDGAQGAGAVPVDVQALGCAFYAAAGQKWLCGPMGTGMLYVSPAWRERLPAIAPLYFNLEDPANGLDAVPHPNARAHDAWGMSSEVIAGAQAAHDTLAAAGWPAVHERAAMLAAQLADELAARGRTVAPRGSTTLVSWEEPDAEALATSLAAADIVLRHLPGRPYVRASVGAWNDEPDLERLLAAIS